MTSGRGPDGLLGVVGRRVAAYWLGSEIRADGLRPRRTRWLSPQKRPFKPKHPRSKVSRDMKSIPRRSFLRGSMTAGLALGMPRLILGAGTRPGGPNDAVNVAVIGLGATTAV